MNRPGSRFFIGPLTPAQQRRRKLSRERFLRAEDLADCYNVSLRDGFRIASGKLWVPGMPFQQARP